MPNIRHSNKVLRPDQIKRLKTQAMRIDREEALAIKAQGRTIFDHHERLRAILQTLVDERKRRELSLSDLADRTGIAKSNLSRLENNVRASPKLDTLERYAQAVGKTIQVELRDAA